MFGMGMGELVVILIVALLFLRPDKLPEAAKAIGKGIRELRKHTRSLEQTIEQDETIGGTVREIKSALRGEEPPPPIRPRPPEAPAVAAIAAVSPRPSLTAPPTPGEPIPLADKPNG